MTMPEHSFLDNDMQTGRLTTEEAFYLIASTRFAYYFMYQYNEDFENLFSKLGSDVGNRQKLVNLKTGLDSENVKIESIKTTLDRHEDLAKLLYQDFKNRMSGGKGDDSLAAKL